MTAVVANTSPQFPTYEPTLKDAVAKEVSRFWFGFKITFTRVFQPFTIFVHTIALTLILRSGKSFADALFVAPFWPTYYAIVLFAPIFEEIVFRGVLQPIINKVSSFILSKIDIHSEERQKEIARRVATVATSAFFAVCHLGNAAVLGSTYTAFQCLGVFALSAVIFCPLKDRYGLSASIGAHVGQNFGVFTAFCIARMIVYKRLTIG